MFKPGDPVIIKTAKRLMYFYDPKLQQSFFEVL